MKLMTALTGDTRYEDHVNDILREEKRGEVTMCGWLDEAEKRGEERGEKRGEKRGRFEMLLSTVNNYIAKKHLTQKAACEDLSISYSEYMAAKRYFKKIELQGSQD